MTAGRAPRRWAHAAIAGALVLAACTSDDADPASTEAAAPAASDVTEDGEDAAGAAAPEPAADAGPPSTTRPVRERFRFPEAPSAPGADDPSPTEASDLIDSIVDVLNDGGFDFLSVGELATAGDARHAWFVTDMLRFFAGQEGQQLVQTFEALTGATLADDPESDRSPWGSATNHMIAWDVPAYPGYADDKAGIFLLLEDAWEPFFTDTDADIDWRLISWGGVFIDDRELGDPEPCAGGCIPALDDPAVTDAAGGDWYADDRTVFGIVENGEALAIPLNIAEIHEMFNLTLGGRRLGIPYCTLCGSAQAYYTDNTDADETPVLRTSGLLSRSNKVMYDLRTSSVFDTFTGAAVSGPLQDLGLVLEETTMIRTTWGEWKAEHPDTSIIAEDGGIGRFYPSDPLGDRDADGPIFPIGAADDRLDVQESVVGVITVDGTPVAFPAALARSALAAGDAVELAGVRLTEDGGGLRATDAATGDDLAAHEAFWFAWSQFHPTTELWLP